MENRSPLFKSQPVIVVHIGTDDSIQGRWLAACSGEVFDPEIVDSYRDIPRVACPGCIKAGNKTPTKLNEITRRLWLISQDDKMIIALAGKIQNAVNELRTANGLKELR